MDTGVGHGRGETPNEALKAVMDTSEQGFALFDETDMLRYANPTFRTMLGLAEGVFLSWSDLMRAGRNRGLGTRVDADDFEAWLRSAQSRRGTLPFRSFETNLVDGRWVLVCETTQANGWMLCVFSDITMLGAEQRDLRQDRDLAQREALTDELTHLSNRRHVLSQLEGLLRPQARDDVAVALLDLDHFKRINDTHGHEAGDEVLRHFAIQLQAHIRRGDLAGRLGGEEFVLALPGVSLGNARAVLERLFDAVRRSEPTARWPTLRYTCSAGLVMGTPGERVTALLRRADVALYEAKGQGRDRYIVGE